jgi:hypothetical protein
MINRIGFAIVAAAMAAATSASAETVYAGVVRTVAVTPECEFFDVGRLDTSHFHPNIAGNSAFSAISFLQTFSAMGYKLNNNTFDEYFRPVVFITFTGSYVLRPF